jgi:hypothetical protein
VTTRLLLDPDGSAILVEPGSYLLYEAEFAPQPPAKRVMHVFPKTSTFSVPARGGIWVPPRPPGVTP